MRSKFKWIFTLLLALSMQFSFAQEKTVTGVVTDNSGPVPGANVVVKGTKRSTQTDFDGKFSISAKAGEVLVISFVGSSDATVTVGAANNVNVKLQEGVKLNEIVVQGYRDVSKKSAVTAQSTVSSKTIENRPNANAINTLQGQLAGVNISASTGQPGAKSTVIIRGVGSYNGSTDPLYVIDGFPSNSDNFRSINPNDIASVDVLKDAAALAEYGSRGSNGVIVIRTRKGKFGEAKTSFRYSTSYGVSDLQVPKYDYANARELLRIEKNYGGGLGATLTDAQINAYSINTNWVDTFFQKGISTNNNLSIENSSKNLNSFTSVSYFDQQGVLKTTNLKRFTVRNNLNGQSPNERLKYSVNTAFGYSKNNEATNLGGGAINRNYVLGAYLSAPYISPDQYTGSQDVFDLYQSDGTLLYTPLFLLDKLQTYSNLTEETRIDVTTELSYKVTKDLTARVRTSGELLTTRFNQAEFPISFNALLFAPADGITGFEDINQRREFLFNNLWQLEYNKTFGKHTFNVAASSEYNHSRLSTNNFRQNGLNPLTFVPNTGAGYVTDTAANDFHVPQISASQLRVDLISYFASFDYDYNKKYGFVASGRRDSASRFATSVTNSEIFWSFGGRWNIEEESFMKSLDAVKILKLRGSVGTVGNQRLYTGTIYAGINPPGFADTYANTNNTYNSGQGYGITFGYPGLKWETTRQYNFGLDFELLKNSRLRGSLEHYNKKTINVFLDQPLSPSTGTTSLRINSDAYIVNKGFEATLAFDVVKNANFSFTVNANGAYNKNTIDGIKANGGTISEGTTNQSTNGHPVGEFFVYPYLGVNPVDGELLFEDINGNATENPTSDDKRATGKTSTPKYQGGFGFDLDYKGFFFSTLFTYAFDVYRFDFDLENLYDPDNIGTFNVSSDMLNAWTPTNTNTNVPSTNAGNRGLDDESDRFLRDASYVRLRNIKIGYKFPKRFLDRTFFTDVAITLQGENLYNFTKWQGFDPESDRDFDIYQYPTPKQVTLGLDLKF